MADTRTTPPQEALDLYDKYAHGFIDRRTFMARLGRLAIGGLTVAALADSLMPNYALAEQVKPNDPRIVGDDVPYPSPMGAGDMMGYLVRPVDASDMNKRPGVVVIHENRGLNPYIRDVARRVATAGYIAFAPDALYPLGGYPGNDDDGRTMQRQRDRDEMVEDFKAAVSFLQAHPNCTGNVGCVGFCFGGSVSNRLAAEVPTLKAAVPFYGGGVPAEAVPSINAPLMIHLGELDKRVNAGWPDYEAALKANGKAYKMHMYAGANHGFHNDTTARYDPEAAELAWTRTLAFFEKHLS
ncbi:MULTISPECIES: dienelactone hydrolase family protein [Kordiimonas]|uniref:dienelactone hydrolase family protein n=1 Tax=Kordiimonas TaxID=288021 RepID=UPI00257990D3|nr:dienelactone hydrolase family protein [Kordiimonas sp. UBA4487]